LAAELKESFKVETELLSGERGDFEVVVDGEKVFSKKKLSRFPEPGEITLLIRQS
jgi:selT/selW/selH-like putative selenoprotein